MPANVDIHENGLPVIEQAGQWRVLGCLPPHVRCALPAWGDSNAILDPSQWRECNLHASWPDISTDDQGKSSSCVGHATDKVFTYAWLASGGEPKQFSPTFVYGLINGGQDKGAVISDALTAVKMYGICEQSLVPEGMYFRQQFPQEAYANARRFKAVEGLQIRSFREICSAISLGFAVISGIYVGRNFGDLDDEGVAPPPDQIVGGHALCHCGLKWSAKRNAWLVLTHNSWSEQWGFKDFNGQGGFCYLAEQSWANVYMDAWAIGGVFADPMAPQLPIAR